MSDNLEPSNVAKQAFGLRLRDLRRDANLSGRQLASLTGMHVSKISRAEHARQNLSEGDIRAWATACGAEGQIPELIAALREVEQMWTEHRRNLRAGMAHAQSAAAHRYEQASQLRVYESNVVPGILQTYRYALAALETVAELHGRPVDEATPAAEVKMERQRLITSPTGKTAFSFVIEAGALDHGFGGMEVMNEQLDFLIEVMRKPQVAFGIIPPLPYREIRPGPGFYLFDEGMARSEMWTGTLTTRRPDEVAGYVKIFGMLRDLAVYGEDARALVEEARIRLQSAASS